MTPTVRLIIAKGGKHERARYSPASVAAPPFPPPPSAPIGDPAAQVNGPAIGLIVTAVVGILFAIIGLIMNLFGLGTAGLGGFGGEDYGQYMNYMSGGLGVMSSLIGLVIGGFLIWVGMQMRMLRQWTAALIGSILAMIPCISPCCLIGLPIGIWSLIVLNKPEVKAAFTK
ncbi:MAG TPA: hypothetical protein VMT16_10565 [Thermoanaerobaculia bacterium]|nr:hypothetical protein [Thermoanaerobaculia bacterium]